MDVIRDKKSVDILILVSLFIGFMLFYWQATRNKNGKKYKTNISTRGYAKGTLLKAAPAMNTAAHNTTLDNLADKQSEQLIAKNVIQEVPKNFLNFQLLVSNKLTSEQQQAIIDISQCFRKPHPLLLPLTQRAFEPNELFELIKSDAQMTAKILTVVNSSCFALQQPITNINHAILFLGVAQVKNITMQLAIPKNIEFNDQAQNQAYNKLWLASYMASAFCSLLAKELNEENPAELSTCCLLSYLGDLAILSYKPNIAEHYLGQHSLFERTKITQEKLHTNSALIGQFLAKQWQLPASIEMAIENNLLMLTNESELQTFSIKELRTTLICYLSCRFGDLVAFDGIKNMPPFKDLSFASLGRLEFYYIQENIQRANLAKINKVIIDTTFRNKVNQLIAQLAS
jgi:HD-like signal output (HDOD) protein